MVTMPPARPLLPYFRPAPPPPPRPLHADPYEVPHLRPTAPPDLVAAAARALAKSHHPDLKPEGLGFRERPRLIRGRLDTYSEALRLSLSNGVDDAALIVRGGRR